MEQRGLAEAEGSIPCFGIMWATVREPTDGIPTLEAPTPKPGTDDPVDRTGISHGARPCGNCFAGVPVPWERRFTGTVILDYSGRGYERLTGSEEILKRSALSLL